MQLASGGDAKVALEPLVFHRSSGLFAASFHGFRVAEERARPSQSCASRWRQAKESADLIAEGSWRSFSPYANVQGLLPACSAFRSTWAPSDPDRTRVLISWLRACRESLQKAERRGVWVVSSPFGSASGMAVARNPVQEATCRQWLGSDSS